jgi:hypothetical protein
VTEALDQWLSTLSRSQAEMIVRTLPIRTLDPTVGDVGFDQGPPEAMPAVVIDQLRTFRERHGEIGVKELEISWQNSRVDTSTAGRASSTEETVPWRTTTRLATIAESTASIKSSTAVTEMGSGHGGVQTSCCFIL